MIIQLLTSNSNSWIIPYGKKLQSLLIERGHLCNYIYKEEDVKEGDVLIFLSYEKVFKNLNLNKHNLVIHESALPKGRGMSPLTWQILEGVNTIPITLLEATDKVDAGLIYSQQWIVLEGHELLSEIKHKQGEATIELVLNFIDDYGTQSGTMQEGEATYYKRRSSEHSKLDVNKTIAEQFNLLRVCDNERYPAFFELNGQSYYLKIEKK